MNILLDTRIMIWAFTNDKWLSAKAMVENLMFMTHDVEISSFKQDCVILV